jgi:hypothetical protein
MAIDDTPGYLKGSIIPKKAPRGYFTKLIQKRNPGINLQKKSKDWFREKATEITKSFKGKFASTNKIFQDNETKTTSSVEIGKMYMFFYDAKWKEELPEWDMFPLIFPIEFYNNGFLGINFHYLPHPWRAALMDALWPQVTDEKMDFNTRLKISYNILKAAAADKYVAPTIHRYLSNHVVSNFIQIPASEWDIAIFLPYERFVGNTKGGVYKNSMKGRK